MVFLLNPCAIDGLSAIRLFLLAYSLFRTCFFADKTIDSLLVLVPFTPAKDLLVPFAILDLTRGDGAILARGITDEPEAARCAPSLAMTREREILGFRLTKIFGFSGTRA